MTPRRFVLICLVISVSGCGWFQAHKAQLVASRDLLAQEALAIAQKTVYSKATDAGDAVLKNFNVAGFGDGLRILETGLAPAAIAQIPDAVMQLRQIWLPGQQHYTDLAAQLGTQIQAQVKAAEQKLGRPLETAELQQIVEAFIVGLQQPPPPLNGAWVCVNCSGG